MRVGAFALCGGGIRNVIAHSLTDYAALVSAALASHTGDTFSA